MSYACQLSEQTGAAPCGCPWVNYVIICTVYPYYIIECPHCGWCCTIYLHNIFIWLLMGLYPMNIPFIFVSPLIFPLHHFNIIYITLCNDGDMKGDTDMKGGIS